MKNRFAIVYDFDGTLTDVFYPRYDILNQINSDTLAIIQKYDYLSNEINGMVNTFMYGLIKALADHDVKLTKDNLCFGADRIKYSKGVENYFENINEDANLVDVSLEHFVITSGIKEYIDKTRVAKYLSHIYGSSYYYEEGIAKWPSEVIESKDKVHKIFEINKKRGLLKYNCNNMIYIGDGLTDFESMKFVKENGGISICVYGDKLEECKKLEEYHVINESFERDYTKDSKLYHYIREKIENSKVGER
ncbi:MAG: HAD family hydrolase [Clostridia bacterium]|nr:HAD family hydrolase [Clostridia bacterium]